MSLILLIIKSNFCKNKIFYFLHYRHLKIKKKWHSSLSYAKYCLNNHVSVGHLLNLFEYQYQRWKINFAFDQQIFFCCLTFFAALDVYVQARDIRLTCRDKRRSRGSTWVRRCGRRSAGRPCTSRARTGSRRRIAARAAAPTCSCSCCCTCPAPGGTCSGSWSCARGSRRLQQHNGSARKNCCFFFAQGKRYWCKGRARDETRDFKCHIKHIQYDYLNTKYKQLDEQWHKKADKNCYTDKRTSIILYKIH